MEIIVLHVVFYVALWRWKDQELRTKNACILQVLNLFLALLLSSFGASNLSAGGGGDDDTSKLSEAFNRIGRFRRWVKNSVMRSLIYVKDRIVECCRRQISARRGKKLLCFSICFKVTLHTFLHHILFYPFEFSLLLHLFSFRFQCTR